MVWILFLLCPATQPTVDDEEQLLPRSLSEVGGPHDSWGGFFDLHFSTKAWRDNVWFDYLTQPPVLLPLSLGAGAAIVSHWDKPLEDHAMGMFGNHKEIANVAAGTLIGGSLVLGIADPGEGRNGWDEIWTQGEAYAASVVTTNALKFIVWRRRPGEGGRNRSFPSGHTSAAFTAATLIELNNGPEFGIPAYGLAVLTGLSRMDTGDHWPSDVLAGAAIGVLSAAIFDALHWGTGRQGHGIAGTTARLDFDGARLGLSFGF